MSHLRIVKDEPPKPKRRKGERSPLLTLDEEKRFRAAMRNLHDAFGSWACLAHAMGGTQHSIHRMMAGARGIGGDMIVRAMRASGLTLAELLGGPVPADRGRACGRVRAA